MRVLIVEDDDAIATPLAKGLEREGSRRRPGRDGPSRARTRGGVAVRRRAARPRAARSRRLRRVPGAAARGPTSRSSWSPPRSEEVDRVVGLELGADDYIVKPFGFRELVARIRAVARRACRVDRGQPAVARPRCRRSRDRPAHAPRVIVEDEEVALTPKEFDLLAFLAEDAGAVRSRRSCSKKCGTRTGTARPRPLDVHVASLRKKLGDPHWIETVRRLPAVAGSRVLARHGAPRSRRRGARGEAAAALQLPLDHALRPARARDPARRRRTRTRSSAGSRATSSTTRSRWREAAHASRSTRRGATPTSRAELQRHRRRLPRASAGGRVVIVDARQRVADSDRGKRDRWRRSNFAARPEVARGARRAEIVSGTRVAQARRSDSLSSRCRWAPRRRRGCRAHHLPGVDRRRPASSTSGCCSRRRVVSCSASSSSPSLLLARSMTQAARRPRDAAVDRGSGDLSTSLARASPQGPARVHACSPSRSTPPRRSLEQLVGSQRGFVADASHQLRTPLAALRLRLENLEADVSGPPAEDLDGALAEVTRLSRLVDGLLVLGARRAGDVGTGADRRSTSSSTVGATPWDAFAAERNVRIEPSVATGSFRRARRPAGSSRSSTTCSNNALEVAPEQSAVRLVATDHGDWVELRVARRGPGHDRRRARPGLRPLLAVAGARRDGRPNGHFGLGLAIVRELVVADGGEVALEPSPSAGSRSIVRLRRVRGSTTPAARRSRPNVPSCRRPPGDRPACARPGRRACSRSRTWRVSSETPTHTSCSTQWPSQWSCSPMSVVSGPSTAARMSASVISLGRAGEHVAAADAALRAHEPGALHREQDLLEVRLGEPGALGDLLHRRRAVGAVQRERQQRPRRVVAPGRHLHAGSLRRQSRCIARSPTRSRGATRRDLRA